jgi:hypothetical protein
MISAFYIISFVIFSFSAIAKADDIYVYRNISNNETLDFENSRRIFDGSKLTWENGRNIVVLIPELDQIEDNSFQTFAQISKSQFLSRWRIKFFSGRALIPIQIKNLSSTFETLKTNPSGIFFSFKELSDAELGGEKKNFKMDKINF